MWSAARSLRSGATTFARNHNREHGDLTKMRYVHVDEFQDFSAQFYELLSGIRAVAPSAQFYCVGDDWQAINGFAGADLRYFTDFDRLFRAPAVCEITTNYRSVPAVVRAGNALMHGLGAPAKPYPSRDDQTHVSIARLDDFSPTPREQELHRGDDLTPAVLLLVRRFLDRGQRVVLLSRRNAVRGYVNYTAAERRVTDGLDRFLGHVRSFLPEEDRERVSISTTLRYKGLDQDAVIILDGIEGSYPLIHPSWVFTRVFGDSFTEIEAAERRLFYVAVTRARDSLVILSEARRPSPYLADIESRERLATIDWSGLPAVSGGGDSRVEVRVYLSYDAATRAASSRASATAGIPSTGTGRGRWPPTGSTPTFSSARNGRRRPGEWWSSLSRARSCWTVGCQGLLPPAARPEAARRSVSAWSAPPAAQRALDGPRHTTSRCNPSMSPQE